MFVYVIHNKTKNKRFVGLAINTNNPVAYHTDRKVVTALHNDLKAGDLFSWDKLATPASLGVAEEMTELYIKALKPEYNV